MAGSVYTATRDSGLRVPVQEMVPEVSVAPQPAPVATPATTPAARPTDGPQIIKVNPTPDQDINGPIVIRDPSTLANNPRTAHLPDRALLEDGPEGPLPVRSADGRRPFDVYAGAWSGTRGAKVAIILGGLGVSQTGTQAAIQKLPSEVTLAFATQGNSLSRWMQAARQRGHEIVMQVPLEPFDYPSVNPGRNTLTVEADAAENVGNLLRALSRTTNFTGVMNYMGARFVTERSAMEPVMRELGRRGLMYVDDGSSARSVAGELALGNSVPYAVGEGVIDSTRERGEILKKLDQLEAAARAKGFAIGTGSAFDETVDAVTSWVAEAKRRGIEIVPVSALASDPEASR
ncbi:MAG: divergent polysaccharide deacetylase family protein [Mesorhizobium sp.]